jgi:hypothetical protein
LNDAEDIHLDGYSLVNQLGRLYRLAHPDNEKTRAQGKGKTIKGDSPLFFIVLPPLSEKTEKRGLSPFLFTLFSLKRKVHWL